LLAREQALLQSDNKVPVTIPIEISKHMPVVVASNIATRSDSHQLPRSTVEIYIGNASPNTTTGDIMHHLNHIGIQGSPVVKMLRDRFDWRSFHVTVNDEHEDSMLNTQNWGKVSALDLYAPLVIATRRIASQEEHLRAMFERQTCDAQAFEPQMCDPQTCETQTYRRAENTRESNGMFGGMNDTMSGSPQ